MVFDSNKALFLTLVAVLLTAATLRADDVIGTVVGVSDGDTLTILTKEKERIRVRFWGIDAPESKQPFGSASKKALSEQVYGREVRVEVLDKDRYGRSVARVFVGDTDVGLAQVSRGLAWWYQYYAKDDEQLRNAEAKAREGQLGLWSEANPVPPWEWRREKRNRPVTK